MNGLNSADPLNPILTTLCSGKETQVVKTYGKTTEGDVEGIPNLDNPSKLISVSMPLEVFKRAVTQRGFSSERFVLDFNINLMAKNFSWSDVALISIPAKIFSKNVLACIDSGSSGIVISKGCMTRLNLVADENVELNIASLNGIEKKNREIFFDVPIEVGNSLVTLPALVADGLFVDVLLGANWLNETGAKFDVSKMNLTIGNEKLKLKKLPDPSENFVGAGFRVYSSECVVIPPGGCIACEVVHCPVKESEICYVKGKVGLGLSFDVFEESNVDGQVSPLSITNKTNSSITLNCGQQIGELHLMETIDIPGNVISSSNKFDSSYFATSSFDFSTLFLNLDDEFRKTWISLLEKWSVVLSKNKYDVGLSDVEYQICLSNPTPIKSYVPRYSQGVREAIIKELDKMKEANFIEPSISPFAAPMVCVRKGDNSLFCYH